ncbi:MAG: glycosyltransferase [Pyrinomonadaceae bacterium]
MSIVIPVRDEALHLEKSLASFSKQVDLRGKTLNPDLFEIIVLTNNCSDNSFEIAGKFQADNESLNLHIADIKTSKTNANSGFIRGLLMQKAHERLISNSKNGGIIMTTDGDTQVSTDWIAANIFEIKNGADAVGGRILFNSEELAKMNSSARRFHLIDEKYRLLSAELESNLDYLSHDSLPRHHQHFNGSFAVTTDAYRKAGGIPDVRFLEDVAFYQSLLRIDAKFRHSLLVKVYTSSRETGRAEAGLSTQINDWINLGKTGADFLVDSAETLEKRFRFQGRLRFARKNIQSGIKPKTSEIKALAGSFDISFKDLKEELFKPQTFGLLLENVYRLKDKTNNFVKNAPPVSIEKAVFDLENKLGNFRRKKIASVSAN